MVSFVERNNIMDIIGHTASTTLKPQISAPVVPTSLDTLGILKSWLKISVLKHLSAYPKSDVLELSNHICVVTHIVESALWYWGKISNWGFSTLPQIFLSHLHHIASRLRFLSEKGLEEADLAFKRDAYLGPAPVSLEQYSEVVKQQDLGAELVTRPHVEAALGDVYGIDKMISVLGPAQTQGEPFVSMGMLVLVKPLLLAVLSTLCTLRCLFLMPSMRLAILSRFSLHNTINL